RRDAGGAEHRALDDADAGERRRGHGGAPPFLTDRQRLSGLAMSAERCGLPSPAAMNPHLTRRAAASRLLCTTLTLVLVACSSGGSKTAASEGSSSSATTSTSGASI